MAQFDLHRNAGRNRAAFPFLLDVQTGRLAHLPSRLVVPVRAASTVEAQWPAVIHVEDADWLMIAEMMFAAPRRVLGEVAINLAEEATKILTTIDEVISSY